MSQDRKAGMPKPLVASINRLANEISRREIWERAKALRTEYAARLAAGESIKAISDEVTTRTVQVIAGAGTKIVRSNAGGDILKPLSNGKIFPKP
jgi:hypothetical protein